MIHKYSERTGNFIPVNCAAIPENLIESALFGAEKGSFTGANEKKIGFFESADNGTIFLDEIGEINMDVQTKFLRVLQENEITRVGGNLPVKIKTRVISATNKEIEHEVKNNKFREDLFYRLNVIRIHIPPLRERKDEIKSLALVFLKEFSKKYDKNIVGFDKQTLEYLQRYDWPGNIRELKNTIEKSVIFSKKEWIEIEDLQNENALKKLIYEAEDKVDNEECDFNSLPVNITQAKKIISLKFEKEFIIHYLKKNNFNITRTGKEIGLHRQDLYKKMKELGINTDMNEKE
jgi:DNA-binding NtrC family response regulator